jgi:hypothetical protein
MRPTVSDDLALRIGNQSARPPALTPWLLPRPADDGINIAASAFRAPQPAAPPGNGKIGPVFLDTPGDIGLGRWPHGLHDASSRRGAAAALPRVSGPLLPLKRDFNATSLSVKRAAG